MTTFSYLIRLTPEQTKAVERAVSIGLGEPQPDLPALTQRYLLDQAASLDRYRRESLEAARECLGQPEFWVPESVAYALRDAFLNIRSLESALKDFGVEAGLIDLADVLKDIDLEANPRQTSGGGVNPSTGLYEIWVAAPPAEAKPPKGWVVVSWWQPQWELFSKNPEYVYQTVATDKVDDLPPFWELASGICDTEEAAEAEAELRRKGL